MRHDLHKLKLKEYEKHIKNLIHQIKKHQPIRNRHNSYNFIILMILLLMLAE